MIRSFACKETRKIFERKWSLKLPSDIQKVALRKLRMLDATLNVEDLFIPPGNHLELMKGTSTWYSIRINRQWRVCFDWIKNHAYNVEIIDYH